MSGERGPKFGRNIMLSVPKRARDEGKTLVSFFECVVGSSRDQFGWRGAGDRMVNFLALGNTD